MSDELDGELLDFLVPEEAATDDDVVEPVAVLEVAPVAAERAVPTHSLPHGVVHRK